MTDQIKNIAPNKRRVGYTRDIAPIDPAAAEAEPPAERVFPMPEATVPDPPKAGRPIAPDSMEATIFTRGPARRPVPRIADPMLQWATGLTTTRREIYAGWLIPSHQSDELDDALLAAGFDCVNIKHGQGNVVEHWTLPSASLFVVAEGVQTMGEMRHTTERYGIAFGWRRTEDGRLQSVLRCRVFVQELLAVGYMQPLLLTVKSTLTGDLLACLMRHYDVLDAVNPLRVQASKPPIDVPYYAVSIALGAGQEVQRGNGGQTKAITPMQESGTQGTRGQISRDYILTHWCKKAWAQAIEAILDDTIAWSVAESKQIAAPADALGDEE